MEVFGDDGEELEQLCSRISLTEREKVGISIDDSEVAEAKLQGNRCLVGRLWTEKGINKEAFKSVLSRLWRISSRVSFKEVLDKLWLFEFADKTDKRRVLVGRPWSFDRQILVLKEFEGRVPPSKMDLRSSPFWIQVHDMPLLCMTKGVGSKIGQSLGELEDVDVAGDYVG
ncbi:uncharacterized protein LOC132169508 [Corylus avellana]|uniref:uncharacterized protein LOC132169508 n=1 Tax=Corylus avellana TaxID=13451 RepID=UPI00286D16AB|nr:uncharacterized protein LOC132169508 [Corylus avellana]